MTAELTGSTALVTGATAGIGRVIALRLAALGASVVVHGRDQQRGAEIVDEVAVAGGSARFVAADLSDAEDVLRLAAAAGEVDVLINNAGIYRFSSTPETTAELFDTHMAINTRAPLLLVGALAPGMAARGRGAIVSLSTVAATTPARGAAAYGASKAALELLTRVWADEFGAQGVRVNAVSPGPVHTPGTKEMGDEALQTIARTTVLGRPAEPEEIAEAVLFLASSRASYITGSVLEAGGGHLAIG
ncbi:SDR family oxidoreductase [Streptomyces sp. NBC_01707]|uniref:SDR family NAD(P)-dependent oxidoreductase n=1 Tax=unclassified Streptomyces TaxID=2593676 RepID=UPI0004C48CE6|nr:MULTISPECIES: SDR family oxidoreductase [unclassified Streptomyces]MDX3771048.1 SDR family NAD(P)-dependent oxidoreductase [Streptomyces sp. AK08-01B]MDX3821245.1 SDR family NAD(P)-dependent oxidoreductase [Streptomyces sp. AK08-01A]WSQ24694.1 SDR family oxidoreductase [Streptomyces sp. NBC_01230]SCY19880.1 NAD(P)-dependent dehydrogenase, short-chain alcohol dehydrogenase family [Streptomyces sp. 136MFCol5.1]